MINYEVTNREREKESTSMVTMCPEATAMRFSSDQAMALGKHGAPISIADSNGLGQLMLRCGCARDEQDDGSNP